MTSTDTGEMNRNTNSERREKANFTENAGCHMMSVEPGYYYRLVLVERERATEDSHEQKRL